MQIHTNITNVPLYITIVRRLSDLQYMASKDKIEFDFLQINTNQICQARHASDFIH